MPTTTKIDVYRQFRSEYITPKKPSLVDVKPARYLAFTGRGEPGGTAFGAATAALYNVVYTIKMARNSQGRTSPSASSRDSGGQMTQCNASPTSRVRPGTGS